ncbi:hypothetical protein ACHAW6_011289 [Cyclotella cf. meneghiniana]
MDNQAFRALVNQNRKTTKQIAREAVENEFRKRNDRSRPEHEGYGSDSDSDTPDAAREKEEPEWKKRWREKKQSGETEYRDRARERREGKNVDYEILDVENPSNVQDGSTMAEERRRRAELSKYLGGDEKHTHLVRGLDRALAQKVKRQETDGKGGEYFDELIEQACDRKRARNASGVPSQSSDVISTDAKSDLGKMMFSYLFCDEKKNTSTDVSKVKINPLLHKSIQRSILTFCLESDVRRRKNAWDAPRVSVKSCSGGQDSDQLIRKSTPLDHQMLVTVTNSLRAYALKTKLGKVLVHKNLLSIENAMYNSGSEDSDSGQLPNSELSQTKDADSDDDIFENVGTYVPPSAVKTRSDAADAIEPADAANRDAMITKDAWESSSNNKKHSIFDNLIQVPTVASAAKHLDTSLRQNQALPYQIRRVNRNVINRDVIGSSLDCQTFPKRRGPHSAAVEGFSMNHYEGGYGEEMDVDFGNFDDDNSCRRGSKNRKNSGAAASGKEKEEENDFLV